jgi:hypothetical protein
MFGDDVRWVVDHIERIAERTAANHRGVAGEQNADGSWPVRVNGGTDTITLPSAPNIAEGDSLTIGQTDGQWEILHRSAYLSGGA